MDISCENVDIVYIEYKLLSVKLVILLLLSIEVYLHTLHKTHN